MHLKTLALSLFLVPGAHADSVLPTVVVSAARTHQAGIRTAASARILDRDEIRRSGAGNLTELLRGRAGIHVSDLFGDGSAASIDMRGFGGNAGSNTLVMIDGRRLNPSSDSATLYLNRIDLDRVEQVEIIQGSAGVLYGNQAVGGVINVITSHPQELVGHVELAAGSYGHRSASASLADRAESGLGYRVSAKRRIVDNYRDNNDGRLQNLAFELDHEQGDNRVWFAVEKLDERIDTPGALFLEELAADRRQAAYANDWIDTDSTLLRLGLRQALNPDWRVEAELAYSDDDRSFVQSFRTFAGILSTQDRRTWELSPRLVGQLGSEQHPTHVTLGLDLQDTDYFLQGLGPQSVDQRIQAVYGQLIQSFDDGLDLSVGLRHARVRNALTFEDFSVFPSAPTSLRIDDEVTVGSLGLVQQLSPGWELFARANQNYRFAKVDEHTNNVFGQPVGLKTQTGITYEIGTRFDTAATQADLILYRIDLDDEIHYDANEFSNVNIDGTRRFGLLGSIERQITPRWRVGGSYNYVDSEITAGPFNGKSVPLVPEHNFRLFAQFAPTADIHVMLEGLSVSRQRYGGDYANRFPAMGAYQLLNLSAGYESGPWRLDLKLNNLTNASYSESGNIGYDNVVHASCIGDGFGGFNCPAENPSPGINGLLSATYLID